MVLSKESKYVIAGLAVVGVAAGGYLVYKKVYGQPPATPVAPIGQLSPITLTRMQGRGALFALPNDVTFLVNGSVLQGNPAPSAQILLEAEDALIAGNWINIGTFTPTGTFAPGQIVTYSRFLTPDQLRTLVGDRVSYLARARMILTNSIGSHTSTSPTVTFSVVAATQLPAGSTTITVSRMSPRGFRAWD